LNQMRSEDGDPEKLLRYSFYQFQADRSLPDLEKQAKELEIERDSMVIEEEESLKDYYDLLKQYRSLKSEVCEIVFSPKYCLPFLQPGRLAQIQCSNDNDIQTYTSQNGTTWGVIINFNKVKRPSEGPEDSEYTVDVLTRCTSNKEAGAKTPAKIVSVNDPGDSVVISVPLSQIDSLSSVRLFIPKDLLPHEARENTLRKVSEVLSRFSKDGIPLLDPEEDMKVSNLF
jgi:ATP-dependent RNA helicase DOB1